jgi:hypothetical protein
MKPLSPLSLLVVLCSSLVAASDKSIVVTGEISDTQCTFNIHSSDGTHASMIKTDTLGRNAEECTRTCVRMGGQYVLVDGVTNRIYRLANPERVVDFAAKRVRVRGITDSKGVLLIITIETC